MRARHVVVVAAALWGAFAGMVRAEDRALFVGVGAYQGPVNPLPGIDKDVENMKAVARRMGFTDAQMKTLMDADSTHDNIRKAIEEWLGKGVGPDDRAFFYFSGHGTRVKDDNRDEADGMDEALVPVDIRKGAGTWENVFRDDELGALLEGIPARRVYAFIDACHSGTLTRSLGGDFVSKFAKLDDFADDEMGKALEDGAVADGEIGKSATSHLVMLTAATEKQQAQATRGGSVFTLGVQAAVDGAARSGRSISPNEVRDFTERFIADSLAKRPQIIHTPTVDGNPQLAADDMLGKGSPARARPAGGSSGPAWAELEGMTRKAGYKVSVSPSQPTYRGGQSLEITVDVPSDGYLNVLSVGTGDQAATVLYPNQFQADNAVKAGARVTIPGPGAPFALPAELPPGVSEQKNLILVVHSKRRLSAFEAGSGAGFLRELTPAATRGFAVAAAAPPSAPPGGGGEGGAAPPRGARYGAGHFIVVIRK